MKNSRAKSLRRLAEKHTVGKPDVCYLVTPPSAIYGKKPVVLGDCTRRLYQKLKRATS